jgi:hypothetical protein
LYLKWKRDEEKIQERGDALCVKENRMFLHTVLKSFVTMKYRELFF